MKNKTNKKLSQPTCVQLSALSIHWTHLVAEKRAVGHWTAVSIGRCQIEIKMLMLMLHQLPNVLVCVPVKGGGRLVKDQEFASSDKHIMMVTTKIIDMLTKMMTKA